MCVLRVAIMCIEAVVLRPPESWVAVMSDVPKIIRWFVYSWKPCSISLMLDAVLGSRIEYSVM